MLKFIINSKEMLKKVTDLKAVIAPKNTLPILDYIKFDLSGSELSMTASDLETSITTKVNVQGEGEGSICVMAKLLFDLLREVKDQPITFVLGEELDVITQSGTYTLLTTESDDFPMALGKESGKEYAIPTPILFRGISKTIFASADDELRPVMNGIYVETFGSKIGFTATDAHRLSWVVAEVENVVDASFILPKKTANVLKGITVKMEGSANITVSEKNVFFTLDGYEIAARQVEGKYPNFRAVIPDNDKKLIVNKDDLLGAIKRVGVFSNKASGLIRFDIGTDLKVSAQDLDYHMKGKETMPCTFDGQPMVIGFKAPFLTEIVSNMEEPEATITLSSSESAAMFNYDGVQMLLMPMLCNQ